MKIWGTELFAYVMGKLTQPPAVLYRLPRSCNMANTFTCTKCFQKCKTGGGLTRHTQTVHRNFTPVSDDEDDEYRFISELHPLLNGLKHVPFM